MTLSDEEKIAKQKDFVKKVSDLSSALIEYKSTKDESARCQSQITSLNEKSKQTYGQILNLKKEVLKKGLTLGLSEEMVIGMVIDMTRSQLNDSYIRKLFAGDFSRGFLPKKPVASSNDGKKGILQHSSTVPVPINSPFSGSIIPTAVSKSTEDVEIVEFDLKQAWNMGLKDHLKKSQKSTTQVWMIKIYVKDGLVKKIENEFSGFVVEDFTI